MADPERRYSKHEGDIISVRRFELVVHDLRDRKDLEESGHKPGIYLELSDLTSYDLRHHQEFLEVVAGFIRNELLEREIPDSGGSRLDQPTFVKCELVAPEWNNKTLLARVEFNDTKFEGIVYSVLSELAD